MAKKKVKKTKKLKAFTFGESVSLMRKSIKHYAPFVKDTREIVSIKTKDI